MKKKVKKKTSEKHRLVRKKSKNKGSHKVSKKKKKTKSTGFLGRKVSRRDFIKLGVAGIGALSIGGYLAKRYLGDGTVSTQAVKDSSWKWKKEAYHYDKLDDNSVQCKTCPNRCKLPEGGRSHCRSKVNEDGKLYSYTYGNPCAVHVDPIEKKPLFHFLPSTKAFSIATAGCTFRCLNCQNWNISQERPEDVRNYEMMPQTVVDSAKKKNCSSIAYTYTEATSYFEYMYDTSEIADKEGIKNLYITNGSINEGPLRALCKVIHAANVDVQAFDEDIYNELCQGSLEPVLNTLKVMHEEGVWFETTHLMVPEWTDDLDKVREMCEWMVANDLSNYPIHFSRFHPAYKLAHLPATPIATLEKAREIALESGMKFAYIGNVPGHEAENTFCPGCGKMIIKRSGYNIEKNEVDPETGKCKLCGAEIAGVWKA